MIMKNIETFDMMVGYVFSELYESFPVCLEIKVNPFLKKIEMHSEKNELILSETLFWLRDSGFINFSNPIEKNISKMNGTIPYPIFSCVVLSAKGLEILKKVPKSVNGEGGIGEEIVDAVKIGAKDSISQLVGTALRMSFTFAM